jgi:hypothetical protein
MSIELTTTITTSPLYLGFSGQSLNTWWNSCPFAQGYLSLPIVKRGKHKIGVIGSSDIDIVFIRSTS